MGEICGHIGGLTYSTRHRLNRSLRAALKVQTLAKYGLPRNKTRLYEDDDRVPVCLGGDNASPLNHWPQKWPEAKIKDRLEDAVCRQVCALNSKMTVERGQAIFLGDWRPYLK